MGYSFYTAHKNVWGEKHKNKNHGYENTGVCAELENKVQFGISSFLH